MKETVMTIIDRRNKASKGLGLGVPKIRPAPANLDTLITANFLFAQPNDPHAGYRTYTVVSGEARSGDDHQIDRDADGSLPRGGVSPNA